MAGRRSGHAMTAASWDAMAVDCVVQLTERGVSDVQEPLDLTSGMHAQADNGPSVLGIRLLGIGMKGSGLHVVGVHSQ